MESRKIKLNHVGVRLYDYQEEHLKKDGNLSEAVRKLIERDMKRKKKLAKQ